MLLRVVTACRHLSKGSSFNKRWCSTSAVSVGTLFHNPDCSKSRATKELLDSRDVAYDVMLYLKDPLTMDMLVSIRQGLGKSAREWIRSGESEYRTANLDANSSDEDVFAAILESPRLLERPIFLLQSSGEAAIGRPPSAVLDLLAANGIIED